MFNEYRVSVGEGEKVLKVAGGGFTTVLSEYYLISLN